MKNKNVLILCSDELVNLEKSPNHQDVLKTIHGYLTDILDPEEVNAQAIAEQSALLEQWGGVKDVLAMPGFNHTPIDYCVPILG